MIYLLKIAILVVASVRCVTTKQIPQGEPERPSNQMKTYDAWERPPLQLV